MVEPVADDMRAIVGPARAMRHFSLERFEPEPPLSRFVDRFWQTTWNLAEPFVQTIVTFPVVNLVFQADGSAVVSGPQRGNDRRQLRGSGWALGVMFRPGGFRPLISTPLTALVDARLPAVDLLGPAMAPLAEAVVAAPSATLRRALITNHLVSRLPERPTVGEELSALVDSAVAANQPVTRVSELARRHGVSVRTLQRLSGEHVGLGPKAVLDRYGVQAATERARRPVESWADVARRLGYADQAHLTGDLSATFGAPPGAYARREAAGLGPPADQ